MPPVGFRKRARSESPVASPAAKKRQAPSRKPASGKSKATLFETVDAPSKKHGSLEENRKFLEQVDEDDEGSSLSEADSDDFEDVPPAKRQKTSHGKREVVEEDGEDDEMDWEDAIKPASSSYATPSASKNDDDIGDVSISLNEDGSYIEPLVSAATGKKGPSKRERQIRVQTHCLHVMSMMWHNTIRNSWLNDKEVQRTLVNGLPDGLKKEVQKWKQNLARPSNPGVTAKEVKKADKGKGKRGKKAEKSDGRDWNHAAESQAPDGMRATSALLRLLKILAGYWRKRFTVTAPGLRKQGYKDLRRLRNEINAWNSDRKNVEDFGERLENVRDFRKRAKDYEGSRDVGAQLFVALLRGLGLEARLVANFQPAGFGWSKAEEAGPVKQKKATKDPTPEVESDSDIDINVSSNKKTAGAKATDKKTKRSLRAEKPKRRSSRGNKADPINLDDSDSPLSDAPSGFEGPEEAVSEDDNLSVVDVTPSIPKKKPHKKFDRDIAFPIYWAEVCDPVSHKYFPVDPVVLSTIASSNELLQTFEPRGKKAELSRQVICYAIAYSADGTAKDVTIRYLKRHRLPGKTKGVRMPVERVPVYNRKGKVRKYEDYDWFRTLISLYDRPESKRTTAEDLEDQTDLKPFKPAKEEKHVEKESLQGYKQSADFVLEPHLRREEAIIPGAKAVKTFTAGKGDKAVDHPVYRRSDIVACKTVESWHKEGRAIKVGEQPMKYVPMRAVTLVRKREMEDAQRETGEKLKQGLYCEAQTDWIIPPPIQNGIIPKNAFGNMDVYVPTMVPKGAIHLPLKGTAKICRKLGIDYAEACTGFEFGNQRAVPVLTGVVVARENEHLVRDAWRAEQEEAKRKEDTKRTATALHWWRKMLLGLRVLDRMKTEYANAGGTAEEINPFVLKARREGRESGATAVTTGTDEETGGGFLPSGDEEESMVPQNVNQSDVDGHKGGGFLFDDKEEDVDDGGDGGFLVEERLEVAAGERTSKSYAPITPVSLQSLHKNGEDATETDDQEVHEMPVKSKLATSLKDRRRPQSKPKAKSTRRKTVVSIEEEESSLSNLSSTSEDEDTLSSEATSGKGSVPQLKDLGSLMRRSPQVVISPPKKATPGQGRKPASRPLTKATPTRSPYFDHSDRTGDDSEDDESDREVVKPRQTTARTKARR